MPTRSHGITRLPDGRRSPTYAVWKQMRRRCSNPKTASYERYGGRGIKVCRRWLKFANFLADMGERPEGTTLDRLNNDRDYSPSNCRWVTRKVNSRNRSDNRLLTLDGQTKTLAEWVEVTGHKLSTLQGRVAMGWSDRDTLTTPARERSGNRRVTIGGITKPLADWCRERGLSVRTVRHRIAVQGLTPEQALQP